MSLPCAILGHRWVLVFREGSHRGCDLLWACSRCLHLKHQEGEQ